MPRYLTKAEKESIICLAGCVGFCATLQEVDHPIFNEMHDELAACSAAANSVMEHILAGVDNAQIDALMRHANSVQLVPVPKLSPDAAKKYSVVPEEAFERLIEDVAGIARFA